MKFRTPVNLATVQFIACIGECNGDPVPFNTNRQSQLQVATVEDSKFSSGPRSTATTVVDTLQKWLDDTVESEDKIVGVSVFLAAGKGKGIKILTSGQAVLPSAWDATEERGVEADAKKITDETAIMLASVSKLLTWTALIMLMDSGKFGIDDPINDALLFDVRNPRFKDVTITYRHLFAHTSGINDSWDGYLYSNDCPNDPMSPYPATLSEIIKEKTKGDSKWTKKKPGSKYTYSNYGCALGALLVERHSGLSFPEFTKKFIFDPLQMTSTRWSRPSDGSAAELYTLFNKKGYKYKTNSGGYCFPDYPSGQLWSTPLDLAKFGKAMLRRGNLGYMTSNGANCLYSEVTGDLAFQKTSPNTGDGDSALGWFVGRPYYKDGAGHDGSETGVSSDFYIHLKSNVAVGFLANAELSNNQYAKILNKLLESAIALGPIENDFDPDLPKDCSTTWITDGMPTASPNTGAPTPSLDDDGGCPETATDQFVYKMRKNKIPTLRTCLWLLDKTNKSTICKKKVDYTDDYGPPQDICPITCDSCGACYENKSTKYSHKRKKNGNTIYKTCNWLKWATWKNRKKICNQKDSYGGYPIPSQACPVTCGAVGC